MIMTSVNPPISLVHTVASSEGVLAQLQDPTMRVVSLQSLDLLCDQFWPQIAEYANEIEELFEDQSFEGRQLAALVLSKVYYHLEDYDTALKYALGWGS